MNPTGINKLHVVDRLAESLVIYDKSVTISISGDVNCSSATTIRVYLLSLACEDGPDEIIVDLSGVVWLDREGIEPIIEAHSLQLARGAVLRLGEVSASVRRFLRANPPVARLFEPHVGPVSLVRRGDLSGERLAAGRTAVDLLDELLPADLPGRANAESPLPEVQIPTRQSDALTMEAMRQEIQQLKDALQTRDLIGQAKGIISILYGCDEVSAFAALRWISQVTNRKLRDVAVLIARTAASEARLPPDIAAQLKLGPPPIAEDDRSTARS